MRKKMDLHLVLKRKWFDMIYYGEKKEEYREIKPYWIKRLCLNYCGTKFIDFFYEHDLLKFEDFDHVIFHHGYSKNRDSFSVDFKGITIGAGKEEWGAEKDKLYFVIKL